MVAIERVSVINSNLTTLVSDYDFTAWELWLTNNSSGVMFADTSVKTEFNLSGTGTVTINPGKAVVVCTRATSSPIPNEKIAIKYELSETKNFTGGVGDKIYIEIDQVLIDNPTLIQDTYPSTDYAQGKNIGVMNCSANYPATNTYLKLRENIGGVWTDVRVAPEVKSTRLDIVDDLGNISTSKSVKSDMSMVAPDFVTPQGGLQAQLNALSGSAPATGADVDTGTDNTKYVTSKAIKDSNNVPNAVPGTIGNALVSNGTKWVSQALPASAGGYDAIVATAGGDYTSVSAAISAGKRRILVKDGTYNNEGTWKTGAFFPLTIHAQNVGAVTINFNTSISGSALIGGGSGEIVGLNMNYTFQMGDCLNFYEPYSSSNGNGFRFVMCKIVGTISLAGGAFTTNPYFTYGINQVTFENCYIGFSGTLTAGYSIQMTNEEGVFSNCEIAFGDIKTSWGGRYHDCYITGASFPGGGFQTYFNNCDVNCTTGTVVNSNFGFYANNSEFAFDTSATGTITIRRCEGCYFSGGSAGITLGIKISGCYSCVGNEFYGFGSLLFGDNAASGNYFRIYGNITTDSNFGCLSANLIYCNASIYFYNNGCTISSCAISGGPNIYFSPTANHNVLSGNGFTSSATIYWQAGSTYNNVVGNSRLGFSGTIGSNEETGNTNG